MESGQKEIEYHSGFIPRDSADVYFSRLNQRSWSTIIDPDSGEELDQLACYYERYSDDDVENLVDLIEEIYETFVSRVILTLYRSGLDYNGYRRLRNEKGHVCCLFFGCDRRFRLKNTRLGTFREWKLGHGDLLYFSPSISERCATTILRDTRQVNKAIMVMMFTEAPLIRRERETRIIKIGSSAPMKLWVDPKDKARKRDLRALVEQDSQVRDIINNIQIPLMEDILSPSDLWSNSDFDTI